MASSTGQARSKSIQDRLSENPGTIIKNDYVGDNVNNNKRHIISPRFILGYWSTRCLGAPLRMMLSAAQVDHWVLFYDPKEDDTGGWDKSSWWNDKEWLLENYPLINLPFLVDCATGRVVSQTNAIATYLGRELNLLGATKDETAQCEELLCGITDLRDLMLEFAYKKDPSTIEREATELLNAATPHLQKLNQHLMMEYPDAKDHGAITEEEDVLYQSDGAANMVCHLVGHNFSAPDFFLWEILDQFEGLCKRFNFTNCLGVEATNNSERAVKNPAEEAATYPYLKEFHDRFMVLPVIQAYCTQYGLRSGAGDTHALKLPYNSPYARFGSCPDPTMTYVYGQEAPWRNRGIISQEYMPIETGIQTGTAMYEPPLPVPPVDLEVGYSYDFGSCTYKITSITSDKNNSKVTAKVTESHDPDIPVGTIRPFGYVQAQTLVTSKLC